MCEWLVQNELCGSNKAITAFFLNTGQSILNHNQDKIQLLKEVSFEIHHLKKDAGTPIKSEILTINAKDMRKSGLGKDVTNKFNMCEWLVQNELCGSNKAITAFFLNTGQSI
jgi:hypothetical protein